jgi:predicted RNase H-like nuclease (RuvC/YqgF family)
MTANPAISDADLITRISNLEKQILTQNRRITSLQDRLTQQDRQFTSLEDRLTQHERQFTEELNHQKQQIIQLNEENATHLSRHQKLASSVESIEKCRGGVIDRVVPTGSSSLQIVRPSSIESDVAELKSALIQRGLLPEQCFVPQE